MNVRNAASSARQQLVLLHGWGSSNAIWEPLLPLLSQEFDVLSVALPGYSPGGEDGADNISDVCQQLLPAFPEKAAYLGWSLGGTVATWLAAHHPDRVSALITVSSNPCFVQREDWPSAMPVETFRAFEQRLARNSRQCLRYFANLQTQGDRAQAELLHQLRGATTTIASETTLANGLHLLKELDLRPCLRQLNIPHLAIFGDADQLVPSAVSDALPSRSTTWIAAGCAHTPQRSRPLALAARLRDFLLTQRQQASTRRNKHEVARSFGAAEDYDAGAELQRDSGNALLQRLPRHAAPRVLDIGSGTGHFTGQLAKQTGAQAVIGLDIAQGMLNRARQNLQGPAWVCGDAEQLPLANESIDLVYSNLTIQWCENLPALARELARCLRPGGSACLSTLGPDTLWELRAAWRLVDTDTHVNRFAPLQDVRRACLEAGLQIDRCDREPWLRRVKNARQLARELRQIGAHNVNPGRPQGLAGKSRWRRLDEAYAQLGDGQQTLPVTWDLCFLVLTKPSKPSTR